MPPDESPRTYLASWIATPTAEPESTDDMSPAPAATRAQEPQESVFAPSPLVPVDRATGYLTTRGLLPGEVDPETGAASSGSLRRLLPVGMVLVLVALLAAGWAMLSVSGGAPLPAATGPSSTPGLAAPGQGGGKPNSVPEPTTEPSRQVPAVAGVKATETNTPAPPTDTPTPAATDTPVPTNTALPTDTPVPTNTALPTDTPVPTNTPIPTDTPAPPTATPVPPTNTPVPFVRYVVRTGDSLGAIAIRYGTTVDAIMRANGLTSTTIFAGQRLIIPLNR